MKREKATTVVLVIAAWVMGALLGSQVQFHARSVNQPSSPVRFSPGVYQIERVDGGESYWVDYATDWQVRFLAR
jgi:hypothetical protein